MVRIPGPSLMQNRWIRSKEMVSSCRGAYVMSIARDGASNTKGADASAPLVWRFDSNCVCWFLNHNSVRPRLVSRVDPIFVDVSTDGEGA